MMPDHIYVTRPEHERDLERLETKLEAHTAQISELRTGIASVEGRVAGVGREMGEVKGALGKLVEAVSRLGDRFNQRPSWAVTMMLTLLSSAVVGLLVFAIKQ